MAPPPPPHRLQGAHVGKNLKVLGPVEILLRDGAELNTVVIGDDLAWVRPGGGLAPGHEGEILGKVLSRPIQQGEVILVGDVCEHGER